MSFRILEFRLGKDMAQGYVLQGLGEHEGTAVSISTRELDDVIFRARQAARAIGHKVAEFSLLSDSPKSKDGPEVSRFIAEFFDRRFLIGHGERMAAQLGFGIPNTERSECAPDAANNLPLSD